jgi:hypothetical protein
LVLGHAGVAVVVTERAGGSGVGLPSPVTLARSFAFGANTPWYLVKFCRGGGTNGASFRKSSTPVMTRWVRPSAAGRFIS